MSHYRDPLAGLRSQVSLKRALVDAREAELSPVLRALLPDRLRRAIHELQPRAQAGGESMAALSDAESALDAIIAAYDEALALASELRECDVDVRDPPSPQISPPWLFEEPYLVMVREAVSARLLQINADARLARWGDFGYISRFRVGDVPIAFVVTAEILRDTQSVARHHSSVTTTVPESLGPLAVSLERTHHVIGKALHIASDVEIGVPAFDDRFWIVGSRAMTALLTPQVRAALEALTDQSPALRIGEGVATLSWSAHWRRATVDGLPHAALDALLGVRAAIAGG